MGLKAGDKVTAVAKDASGNTSTPTEKTVGKGDAKGVKTPVVNPVKAGDTAITGTAEAGSTVGVTLPNGSKVPAVADKDGKFSIPVAGLKAGDKVSVTATDAAGNKSGATVAKATPTATDVKVNNDGSVVVTFADGSVATIAANKVVKEATKESSAQAPAKKAGAKELPNTGTEQSNASLGLALLAAVTGGLLISKKRKEEE